MRTSNPALKQDFFQSYGYQDTMEERMSVNGAIHKTGILAVICFATAIFTWNQVLSGQVTGVNMWMIGGAIGGLIVAMITIFKPGAAPITAPIYAALEGLFLGGISAFMEVRFPGLPLQAILLTMGVLVSMLFAYRSGIIRVSNNFMRGVAAATGAIFLVYAVSFVMSFFGTSIPLIHSNGLIGIGFSLVVVVIAALNLVLDFHFIEEGAKNGAPKKTEWYAAFSLMVTLVWLYIEILRLLSKLQSRD